MEILGHAVVEEAATDVIALHHALGKQEPWREPDFVDRIVDLQRKRQLVAGSAVHRTTFEQVHEDTYRGLGFDLIEVAADPLPVRVTAVENAGQELRR